LGEFNFLLFFLPLPSSPKKWKETEKREEIKKKKKKNKKREEKKREKLK